jgi:hypothetical protein
MEFASKDIEELMGFVEPDVKKKICTLIMFKPFSVPDISRTLGVSIPYVDRTVKFMEAKEWIKSNVDESKIRRYYISEDVIMNAVNSIGIPLSLDSKNSFIKLIHNPIFLFSITKLKKFCDFVIENELMKKPEKLTIMKFAQRFLPEFVNPIEGIHASIISLTLLLPFFEGGLLKKTDKDNSELLLDDDIFGKLVETKEKYNFYLKEFVELSGNITLGLKEEKKK